MPPNNGGGWVTSIAAGFCYLFWSPKSEVPACDEFDPNNPVAVNTGGAAELPSVLGLFENNPPPELLAPKLNNPPPPPNKPLSALLLCP